MTSVKSLKKSLQQILLKDHPAGMTSFQLCTFSLTTILLYFRLHMRETLLNLEGSESNDGAALLQFVLMYIIEFHVISFHDILLSIHIIFQFDVTWKLSIF